MDSLTWDCRIKVEAVRRSSRSFSLFRRSTSGFSSASPSPPPRPPLPTEEELSASSAPPRPPLPHFEFTAENNYDRDLPHPQHNQPILVRDH